MSNMRKLNLVKGLLLAVSGVFLANSLDSQVNPLGSDDVDSSQLRAIIVEGWEKEAWDAEAIPGAPEGVVEANIVAGRPINLGNNSKNQRSMGVRFNFVYPGNNAVVLTPKTTRTIRRPTGQLDENNQPIYKTLSGVELPGRVDSLSVWVLGRGSRKLSLEAWLEDWRGDTFVARFGALDHVGWKPVRARIPSYVPQRTSSFPHNRSMMLKRLVIRTEPTALSEEVVIFLDSLKILSTVYDLYFDGADMSFDERDAQYRGVLNYQKQLVNENQDN